MAMLAERKRKQKWALNPRGKYWSEDQNKFGQKMLEKMGWSKGKGLGSNLHGMTEHIHVSYKNDQNGIGYKAKDDQWTEHQESFDALLQNLTAGNTEAPHKDTEPKFKSLEAKSKGSKARVHYAKFTRGKDLSRASAKDLANIFGKKTLQKTKDEVQKEEEQKDELKKGKVEENQAGSSFMNGGSMLDYFKKKLPGYGKNAGGFVVGNNGVLKKESDSEDEGRAGFGFGTRAGFGAETGFTNSAFDPFATKVEVQRHVLNPIEEQAEETGDNKITAEETTSFEAKKLKKSSKRKSCIDTVEEVDGKKRKSDGLVENQTKTIVETTEETGIECTEEVKTPKKKKKKKNNNTENGTHFENALCNNEDYDHQTSKVENCYEVVGKEKKTENPYEVVRQEKVKDQCEVVRKEKKKKKKKNKVDTAVEVDAAVEDAVVEEAVAVVEVKQETPKKKKKKSELVDETRVNPCFVEETGNELEAAVPNPYEVARKQKQKKRKLEDNDLTPKSKKQKLEASAIENPTFDTTVDDSRNNNEFEVVRKKKKKADLEISAVDNPVFDDVTCDASIVNNNAFEVSRKEKNKKKKMPVDNPTFTEEDFEDSSRNTSNRDNTSSIDNNTFEVQRKAKKIKKLEESEVTDDLMLNVTATPVAPPILKPASASTTKKRRSVRFSAVNEERIIPNLDDLARNELFDINAQAIQVGVANRMDAYRKKIEEAQAQLENEMNQAKIEAEKFVGETETTEGEAERLENGHVMLKFKDAKFHKTPGWGQKDATSRAKAAYKKRIRGDIVVQFNNCNLHEIKGYATLPVRR